MNVVNLDEKFSLFSEYWSPKIVGALNGQHVKLVKLKGDFVWHRHEEEDELFFVIKGSLKSSSGIKQKWSTKMNLLSFLKR